MATVTKSTAAKKKPRAKAQRASCSAETKVPRVSREELTNYLDLEEQRKELARKASDLKKMSDEIEERMVELVKATGGRTKRVRLYGYELALDVRRGTVSWKKAFVAKLGQPAAEKVIQQAPLVEVFSITPQVG